MENVERSAGKLGIWPATLRKGGGKGEERGSQWGDDNGRNEMKGHIA